MNKQLIDTKKTEAAKKSKRAEGSAKTRAILADATALIARVTARNRITI